MTDNLDMLPEAVRRALGFLPSMACTRDEEDAVNAIRTELLRLARENAELRDSDRRAKAFAAAKQRDCLAQMCRAEKAEAERDELRRRIEDAPVCTLSRSDDDVRRMAEIWSGKRVRLVVIE